MVARATYLSRDRPAPMSAGTDPAAIDAVELLQRRLMECECMSAMYGEDAGGDAGSSFEVCNPDVASALTAVVDAWEASGDAAGVLAVHRRHALALHQPTLEEFHSCVSTLGTGRHGRR